MLTSMFALTSIPREYHSQQITIEHEQVENMESNSQEENLRHEERDTREPGADHHRKTTAGQVANHHLSYMFGKGRLSMIIIHNMHVGLLCIFNVFSKSYKIEKLQW